MALNFSADLVPIAEIAPSYGSIWDKFSEQR